MKKNTKKIINQSSVVYFKQLFLLVSLTLFLAGCEKMDFPQTQDQVSDKSLPINSKSVPSEYFDWDNIDFMPTPPGYSSIPVPWSGYPGSINSFYSADVCSDHNASDGWELLYSTFSSTYYTPRPYFILYNKYRGLMRIYQYNDNQTLTTSSKVLAGINWEGNGIGSNKVLSYLGKTLIDENNNITSHYSVEAAPKNSQELPVSPYKWYMIQYEIAYDPSIVPTNSQTPPTLSWYMNYNDITQISLGGSMVSKPQGKAGSSNLSKSDIDLLNGIARPYGKITYDALGIGAFVSNPGLNKPYFDMLKNSFNNILSSMASGNLGPIAQFFGGVIGGKSNGTTTTLKIDATLKLSGTSTSSGNLFAGSTIYMPGSLAKKKDGSYYVTTGLLPHYDKNLGVFNISSRPTVPLLSTDTFYDDSYPGEPRLLYERVYGWVDNSSCLVFNPEVLKNAYIEVVRQDAIVFAGNFGPAAKPREMLDGYWVWVNPYITESFSPGPNKKAVRFVVKVTPKPSSINIARPRDRDASIIYAPPSSYIIKTFLAD